MKKHEHRPADAAELRRRAEARLTGQRTENRGQKTELETARLVHELQVHQIELEMQNEELRQTRAKAEALLAQYTDLYDFAPVGYLTLNERGLILEANLTAAHLLGVARSELRQQPLTRFILQADGDIYDQHRRRLLETRAPQRCELRMKRLDGTALWVSLDCSVTPGSGDAAPVRRATLSDITQRKQAEADCERLAQFERLAQLMKCASDSILLSDEHGRILEANDRALETYGYSLAELRQKTMEDLRTPESPAELPQHAEQLEMDGRAMFEAMHQRRDGVAFPVEISARFLEIAGVRYRMGIVRDITRRKRAEQQIARLALFVNTANDAIIGGDNEGRVTYWNEAAHRLYGWSAAEAVGRLIEELVPMEIAGLTRLQVRERVRQQGLWRGEAMQQDRLGRRLEVELSISPIRDATGQVVGAFGVNRDITERKRAEEALRDEKEFAEGIIETAQTILLVFDPEGRIVRFNPYMEEISGYALAEVQGKDWFTTFLPERDRERMRRLFLNAIGNIQTRCNVNPIVTKDGREREIEWYDRTLKDAQGNIAGLLSIGQDVTARKLAEADLARARQHYQELFDNVAIGLLRSTPGPEGAFIAVNQAMVKMMEADNREQLMALHPCEIYLDPSQRSIVSDVLMSKGFIQGEEVRFKTLKGRPVWGRISAVKMADANGQVYFDKTIEDITERKGAELAVRESEERHRTILRTAMDGFWRVGRQGRLLEVNEAYCRMSGYSEQELLTMHIPDLEDAETPADTATHLQRILARGEDRFESRHRRKDGSTFAVEVSVQYKPAEGGRLIAFLRDITERQRAEEALRELSLQLSRAEDAERRRLARELHDSTGQKLAALSMTVGLLQDATTAPGGKTEKMFADCLAMIEQCAQEIRTLSYLLHPPLLDELGLIVAIGDYVEGFSKRSGVQVTLDAPPDLERLPPEAELVLFRVVQESLGNIHRHAGASAVRIHLACDAEQVTLAVSDEGRGMSAETIRAIETVGGAAGVGIAGMRERLRLLGGRLEIKSGKGGTTVLAIIPRPQEPA